jgi:hypothetical protein
MSLRTRVRRLQCIAGQSNTGTVLREARDYWSGADGLDVLWDRHEGNPPCTGWEQADRVETLFWSHQRADGTTVRFHPGETIWWRRFDDDWTSGTVLGVEGGLLSVRAVNGRVLLDPAAVS